jgi:hypothetical protein
MLSQPRDHGHGSKRNYPLGRCEHCVVIARLHHHPSSRLTSPETPAVAVFSYAPSTSAARELVMHLHWNFTGRAAPISDRVQGLQIGDFQIDGQVVLPIKGDLVQMRVSDGTEPVWFKCSGRRFDFALADGPVLHVDLELA